MKHFAMVAMAVVLLAGLAGAEVILQQGFENYLTTDVGWQGDLATVGGRFGPFYDNVDSPPISNRVVNAADTTIHSGSNAVAALRVATGTDTSGGLSFDIYTTQRWKGSYDAFEYSFWMMRDTAGAGTVMYLLDADKGTTTYDVGFYIPNSGQVAYRNNGAWVYIPTSTLQLTVGEWFGFKLDVNLTDQSYDVHYRDALAADWSLLASGATYTNELDFNRAWFVPQPPATQDQLPTRIILDDFLVVAIPEPGTLALVLLAAGILFRFARARRHE